MPHRPEIEPLLDVETEYRAIEAALLETARGRWFLAEHSRRSRRIESLELESALTQLKASLRDPPALLGRLHAELEGISGLLDEARAAALSRSSTDDKLASAEPHAPTKLLQAAEHLHEQAWALQANEVDAEICERIGRQTAAIFALSVRQAQESQRSKRQAEALDAISDRVAAVLRTIILESTSDTDTLGELPSAIG
ncbi:MAG: hypothetical protein ACKVP7_12610 [Hyphomicrobiaceae bacterium]